MIKNKYVKVIFITLTIIAFIFSCVIIVLSKNSSTDIADNTKAYSEQLFDETKVSSINIELSDEDWQDMLENPLDEEYKCGNITINGETIYNVGIRTKGNTSLTQVASSESDRYSIKVKFDKYVNDQTYNGLDMLNLNNIYLDPTYLKEYISYDLFEYMGVTTPNNSFSNITINGDSWGLYLAVEGLQESYLERNYGIDSGNLYKAEGTGTDLVYDGEDQSNYSGLKNNSVKNVTDEDFQSVVDMIKNLNQGTNLDNYIDIDATMRYFAVSTALVNLDSYQSNLYHNYYIYEKDGVCTILPWDLNLTFGAFSGGGGGGAKGGFGNNNEETDFIKGDFTPPTDNMTPPEGDIQENMTPPEGNIQGNMTMPTENEGMTMGKSSANSIIFYPIEDPTESTMESSPLLQKLLEVDEYKELYYKYLNEIVENYFNSGIFKDKLYSAADLIDEYVKNDATAFYSYEEFESSTDELYKLGTYRAEGILMQLNGEVPKTSTEQATVDLTTYFTEDPVDTTLLGGMGAGGGMGNMGGGKISDNITTENEGNIKGGDNRGPQNMPNRTDNNSDTETFMPNTIKDSQSQQNTKDMEIGQISTNSIIALSISIGTMIISVIFVLTFSRRKYKTK